MAGKMEIQMDPSQKQMLDDVFDAFQIISGGNFVSLMHVEGGVTRYSPGAVDLFRLPGEYIPNGAYDWVAYVHPEDRRRYLDVMGPLGEGKTFSYNLTYRVKTRTGEYANCRFAGATIRNAEGKPSLIGGMIMNQGLMENTDPITVLTNKYGFFDAVGQILREDRQAVALLLGISRLSRINEKYGYSYGNRMLQEISWLAQETVAGRGTVYRMDDATFAVLTETLSAQELAAIYDSIRLRLQRGITIEVNRHNLTANGGLISIRPNQPNMNPESVYSCLTYAYRESKHHRHGELVDFNGSAKYGINKTLEMVNVIRDAIIDGCKGFSVYYQPIVDAETERPIGVEALMRWTDERYGEVEPLEFIPILEKDFVFEELGNWLLRQVAADGVRFLERDSDFLVSVNISASQLEDEYFIDSVVEALEETGFPAKNLCLEVTKGCRLLDLSRLEDIVSALHRQNIRVTIDDFGTGFESIGFLKKLSADFIKFDRELVRDIETDDADRETMRCLASCAVIRGTGAVAKGVQTAGMRDILRSYHIAGLQGSFYSMPVRFEEIMNICFPQSSDKR